REPALRLEARRIPRSGSAHRVDGQTRLESDAILAALLAGDVPVRGAAAGHLLPVLSLAPSAAAVRGMDLSETQGPGSTARTAVEGSEIKSRNTEQVTPSDDEVTVSNVTAARAKGARISVRRTSVAKIASKLPAAMCRAWVPAG